MGTSWTGGKAPSILNRKAVCIVPQAVHYLGMSSVYVLKRRMCQLQRRFWTSGKEKNLLLLLRIETDSLIIQFVGQSLQ